MKRSTIWGILFGAWFGGSLAAFTGLNFTDWKWWAIFLPTAIFAINEKRAYNNENQKP